MDPWYRLSHRALECLLACKEASYHHRWWYYSPYRKGLGDWVTELNRHVVLTNSGMPSLLSGLLRRDLITQRKPRMYEITEMGLSVLEMNREAGNWPHIAD